MKGQLINFEIVVYNLNPFLIFLSQLSTLIKDNVVFTILSERRLGPRLHACFAEGRLEEFVPSR